MHRASQRAVVLFSEVDRKQRARAHRKSQENRRQKRHERVCRAHRCQRVFAQRLPDNERVGDVVKLLEQIPRNHRQRKQQKPLCDISFGQIAIHDYTCFR